MTHKWGRQKARERYAEGGQIKGNYPLVQLESDRLIGPIRGGSGVGKAEVMRGYPMGEERTGLTASAPRPRLSPQITTSRGSRPEIREQRRTGMEENDVRDWHSSDSPARVVTAEPRNEEVHRGGMDEWDVHYPYTGGRGGRNLINDSDYRNKMLYGEEKRGGRVKGKKK